jgi:DNA-binding transcriptional LysR family regulator
MDLLLMRSLLAVADAGAITEAADRMGITQPALSRRIQTLEEYLGVILLERGRKGARLTSVGKLVEASARDLVARFEHLRAEVAAQTGLEGGTIRLGGGATAVSFVLPPAIASFQAAHPGIRFEVKEAGSREIEADVVAGVLELGLVTLPVQSTGLIGELLVEDEVVLVCPREHPLANVKEVHANALAGYALVGFERGSAIRHIIDAALREAQIEMNVVMELRSIPAILRMVVTTGNLAFVSRMGVDPAAGVTAVDVHGLNIRRELGVVARRGAVLSPSASAFAACLRAR